MHCSAKFALVGMPDFQLTSPCILPSENSSSLLPNVIPTIWLAAGPFWSGVDHLSFFSHLFEIKCRKNCLAVCCSQILALWPAEYQMMETFLVADRSQSVARLQFWEEEGSAVQVSSLCPLWLFGSAMYSWVVIFWASSTFLNEELDGNSHSVFFFAVNLIYFGDALTVAPAECLHAWWTSIAGLGWGKGKSWGKLKAVRGWDLPLIVSEEIFPLCLTTGCNLCSARNVRHVYFSYKFEVIALWVQGDLQRVASSIQYCYLISDLCVERKWEREVFRE